MYEYERLHRIQRIQNRTPDMMGATTKRRAGKRRAGNCRAGKRRAENWRAGKRRTL